MGKRGLRHMGEMGVCTPEGVLLVNVAPARLLEEDLELCARERLERALQVGGWYARRLRNVRI